MSTWKPHVYRVGKTLQESEMPPDDPEAKRREIEPWLTAVFQSEHFSLLTGTGLTTAVANAVGATPASMDLAAFRCDLEAELNEYANNTVAKMARGKPNVEDQIRAINALIAGLTILKDRRAEEWEANLGTVLDNLMKSILGAEKAIKEAMEQGDEKGNLGRNLLESFLLSFASRAASRDRLNLFTTNYDRLIEHGCDLVGLHVIDRFVGGLSPIYRSSRLDIDMHYNPPGIRGEPRFLEGVIKLFKLHGSVDWHFQNGSVRRYAIPFGVAADTSCLPAKNNSQAIIYPNPAKDMETSEYPYADIFRDFAAAVCRPNSVLVTYGYGFGDDHINRGIRDMLTIPSTHLVIISYDDPAGRIERFCQTIARDAQISLLIGNHFGSLPMLVEHYLPKPAIDLITYRKAELLERRGLKYGESNATGNENVTGAKAQ